MNDNPLVLAHLARAYAISGRKGEALKTLDQLKEIYKQSYVNPYCFAIAYAALGEKDQAFERLEKGYEDRAGNMDWLKVDPSLDNLRSDPRFKALLKRMNMPE